jgi:hypothetical protein
LGRGLRQSGFLDEGRGRRGAGEKPNIPNEIASLYSIGHLSSPVVLSDA